MHRECSFHVVLNTVSFSHSCLYVNAKSLLVYLSFSKSCNAYAVIHSYKFQRCRNVAWNDPTPLKPAAVRRAALYQLKKYSALVNTWIHFRRVNLQLSIQKSVLICAVTTYEKRPLPRPSILPHPLASSSRPSVPDPLLGAKRPDIYFSSLSYKQRSWEQTFSLSPVH